MVREQGPMYILGMLCGAIWPGNIPGGIQQTILVRPATGLGMIMRHTDTAKMRDQIGDIVAQLPAGLSDPDGGVSIEDQGPFWLGYYHYKMAAERSEKYGPKELQLVGEALYGEQWQSDLARDLELSDTRRIRQWLSSARPVPVGVWVELAANLRQRQVYIEAILSKFDGGKNG